MAVEVDRLAFERDGGEQQLIYVRGEQQQVSVIDIGGGRAVSAASCDGAATNGREALSVSPPPFISAHHRLHFLTRCGNVWAGCLRDKAQHCWSMFTKRKKGKPSFTIGFLF